MLSLVHLDAQPEQDPVHSLSVKKILFKYYCYRVCSYDTALWSCYTVIGRLNRFGSCYNKYIKLFCIQASRLSVTNAC